MFISIMQYMHAECAHEHLNVRRVRQQLARWIGGEHIRCLCMCVDEKVMSAVDLNTSLSDQKHQTEDDKPISDMSDRKTRLL